MCGRLVNLDTVARVLAEYYHIKTDTQLAALNEALSRVPTETVGDSHKKDHIVDPNKMVGDLISRRSAIDALDEQIRQCDKALSAFDISMKDEYAVKVERASLVAFRETFEYMPSAQQNCDGCKWSDAIGYGECHHCKRAYEDMYEKGVQP